MVNNSLPTSFSLKFVEMEGVLSEHFRVILCVNCSDYIDGML